MFWGRRGSAVTGGVRPVTGHYETLNVSPTIVNCSGGASGEGPNNGVEEGGDRCDVRLARGRGMGFVCNVVRGRFETCCRGTRGTRNGANTMLLALVREELSGIVFELNLTTAEERTERLIDRDRFAMGNGGMGVPSCLIGINSMVRIGRGDHSATEFGTVTRNRASSVMAPG